MDKELSLWVKKILIGILIITVLYVLYVLESLVLMLVISGFITILINPLAEIGERHNIPSWISVIGIYIIIFILGSIVIGTLIPIVVNYITDTINVVINWANTAQAVYLREGVAGFKFHPYIEKGILLIFGQSNIEHTLDIIKQNAGNIQSIITTQITSVTTGSITLVSAVGGAVANWALIGITTFLMVLERKKIGKFLLEISPSSIDTYLRSHYASIQGVCTTWIKATLILSVSIFTVTYIGLYLIEFILNIDTIQHLTGIPDFTIEKKFTLAIIGGIMEFIPYIGPLLALIPAAIIGLGISWKVAIGIILLYLIIQRIENDFLVPYVMSKALDLSPFLVFVVMLAGATLGGILGIILAVPIAGVVRVIYRDYRGRKGIEKPTPLEAEKPTTDKKPRTKKSQTPQK